MIFFAFRQIDAARRPFESRRSFCASTTWRPQLRLGLQSLGLPQKDSLLLLMI
jgi:hypothetical protein